MATVLLVEDDPGAREGLVLALRRLGYVVRAAETGEAALRDFPDAAADVVVLDVMLPGLDGFEVCRRLRDDDMTRAIPGAFGLAGWSAAAWECADKAPRASVGARTNTAQADRRPALMGGIDL